jgi:hypothetical protein
VLTPAEFRIARIVGEQRPGHPNTSLSGAPRAVPNGLAGRLEDLLVIKLERNSSGLEALLAMCDSCGLVLCSGN